MPKFAFQERIQQRTLEQFADMPALRAMEHSANTVAEAVETTVAYSFDEGRPPEFAKYSAKAVAPTVQSPLVKIAPQRLQSTVPRQPLQLSIQQTQSLLMRLVLQSL